MIVFLWTVPRTRSTILEKCVSNFVKTMHEPFSLLHYSKDVYTKELIKEYLHDDLCYEKIIKDIQEQEKQHGNVVVKELAYCAFGKEFLFNKSFFENCRHVVLLREPNETIPSLVKQMRSVYGNTLPMERIEKDIGFKELGELVETLRDWNCPVAILHSSDLVTNSSKPLVEICDVLQVPFSETYLKWSKGSLPDWKVWDSFGWHDGARDTTCFKLIHHRDNRYDHDMENLVFRHRVYYERILKSLLTENSYDPVTEHADEKSP